MDAFKQELRPSPARRGFGAMVQGTLGAMLLVLAALHPPASLLWLGVLVAIGIAAVVMAWRGWQGSVDGLVLDETGLWQLDGTPVAPLAEIEAVDRGVFAFKPSNGFLLKLRRPLGRAWVPGMWWRIGRRVGVGGMLNGAEARLVADALSMMVAERDGR